MFGSVKKSFEIIRPTLKIRKIVVQFRSVDNDACHIFPRGLIHVLWGRDGR